MKRVVVILLVVFAILSVSTGCKRGNSSQEEYLITCTLSVADTTALYAGQVKFKEEVEKNSDGRIKVNIYHSAQLGSDRETIEGTQLGQITMMCCSIAPQVNFVPDAAIFDLHFLFPNKDIARKTFQDPVFVEKISASYARQGLHFLGVSDLGFRILTTNKPVNTPEDVRGMTIRTMENKYHLSAWRAIGANPTPMSFAEVFTGLQQGTLDAQENPIDIIYSQKLQEVQRYMIFTNHVFSAIGWIMNLEFYNKLPADLKKVVDEAAAATMLASAAFVDENEARYEKLLREYGTNFISLSADEFAQFEQRARQSWDMVRNDVSPDVYNAFMAALEKARN